MFICRVSGALSLNAATFASVCLASRLNTTWHWRQYVYLQGVRCPVTERSDVCLASQHNLALTSVCLFAGCPVPCHWTQRRLPCVSTQPGTDVSVFVCRVSGALSLNAAMFASVCLASRLNTTWHWRQCVYLQGVQCPVTERSDVCLGVPSLASQHNLALTSVCLFAGCPVPCHWTQRPLPRCA